MGELRRVRIELAMGRMPDSESWLFPYRSIKDVWRRPQARIETPLTEQEVETLQLSVMRELSGSGLDTLGAIRAEADETERLLRETGEQADREIALIRAAIIDLFHQIVASAFPESNWYDSETSDLMTDVNDLLMGFCYGTTWEAVESKVDGLAEDYTDPEAYRQFVRAVRPIHEHLYPLQESLFLASVRLSCLDQLKREYLRPRNADNTKALRRDLTAIEETVSEKPTPYTDPLLVEEGGKWKWKGTPSELAAVVYVAPCDYPPEQEYSKRAQYFRAYVDFDNWKAVVEVCKRLKQGRTPSLPEPRVERLCRMLTDIIVR